MSRFVYSPAAIAALALVPILLVSFGAAPDARDEQWKAVEEAVNKGLPKTAIEKVQPILEATIKEKAWPEAIKAMARKIALEGEIQGNKPEERIIRIQAEIAKAPAEMQPVLKTILAHTYWSYFQQNRWRFLQRTATAEPPSDDFTTWDLPRIYREIDKHFTAALATAAELKKIPVAQYDALLEKGNIADSYRPTLYDFLVFEALSFYASGEQAGAQPEDAFELSADSPALAPLDDFLAWKPESTDENSVTLKAIKLFQELLRFHKDDKEVAALVDADLARLSFAYNKSTGEEKAARYKAALRRLAAQHATHEVSTLALAALANVLQGEGELVEARKVAMEGAARFPDSVGGKRCFNIVKQIEAKSLHVTTERVWGEPWPTIDVSYRNLRKIHFRLVAFDWEAKVAGGKRFRPEYLDHNERKALLAEKPVLTWEAELPPTEDFKDRVEKLAAPKDIKPGSYFLISSADANFGEKDNLVHFTDVWVSDLAIVTRQHQGDALVDGFVLKSQTGEPVVGAQVKAWFRDNNGVLGTVPPVTTNENGLFTLAGLANQRSYFLMVSAGGQKLANSQDFWVYSYAQQPRAYQRVVFFTDRALYRPGQTVHFKGLCIAVDQEADSYKSAPNRKLTVVFSDPNGKEIARQEHQANDYGSFNGSFTAPRDRLMGNMRIHVDGEGGGMAAVQVEEYKRPKFQVKIDAPKEPARLNGEVRVVGKATAYTGAAIDGAKVKWRVTRQARYPIWFSYRCWWMPYPPTPQQEIAHGTATTGTDGNFEIAFLAKPDLKIPEKDEPTFHYQVTADVVDTTGETRSGSRSVIVGYTALAASITAPEWMTDDKPIEITINTRTLDGEGQAATGTLKIYKLRQPKQVQRPNLGGGYYPVRRGLAKDMAPPPDPANPNSWPLGELATEKPFTTDATGKAVVSVTLAEGMYRAQVETKDKFGKPVAAELPLRVLDPDATKLGIKIPNLFAAEKWSIEPGNEWKAIWGTGYDTGRAYVEIEHRRKIVQAYWTKPNVTQAVIQQKIEEAHRGGFTVRVTMVRENRAFLETRKIDVPWSNKQLTLKWEHFVSKLTPNAKETWTAVVTGPDSKKAVAEMVAALYDASLDAYRAHSWMTGFGVFRQDHSNVYSQFENQYRPLAHLAGNFQIDSKDGSLVYRHFPEFVRMKIISVYWGYGKFRGADANSRYAAAEPQMARRGLQEDRKNAAGEQLEKAAGKRDARDEGGTGGANEPDLSQVAARKNLQETAFFYPHIVASKEGEVRIEFTIPEALTEWKFLGFAHDNDLRGGLLTDKAVTSKDLMIQPNPPRFLREGDELEFTVKVSNQSASRQAGKVRLSLADARTGKSVDEQLANMGGDQAFDVPAGESRSFSWKLKVADDLGLLTYKAVGSSGRISDGEEGFLPVLSKRILVTESLPLPIRGQQSKQFEFTKLKKSGESDTLKSKSLSVQMVSNPSWYAVMALPYLMESQHECTEQVFNRLYANSLARHIALSDPKIRRVFDQWKGTPALDSPLEKNEDLKSVVLEETPWVRQAQAESQVRRNVGILFDDNRLASETSRLLKQLADSQLNDGAWPWFPGGWGNDYITLYITTGFGRLRHLGVKVDVAPAVKSLGRLDNWIKQTYEEILRQGKPDENHLNSTIALYLYGRSFFLTDKPIAAEHKAAVDYFLGQAKKYWVPLAERQSQGHLALALKRFGDAATPKDIVKSLKERSVSNEEMGTFWRDTELSWWWYRAPIETQALMIEVFDEVAGDLEGVEELKVWLIKQKQTQDWKTTKATADAVYALLLRGSNQLASDALVEVNLGGTVIKPENVEAGTGFYEQKFVGPEIKPELGTITLKKSDPGVAWGSLHWQYMEDIGKVTSHTATPLTLRKTLYTKQSSKGGPVLQPLKGPVEVGDELVVRIELRTDRDMEYVHLKDHRASGSEPVNVLSQWKHQDGLRYYESTRDTASHFFIEYLPKGTYVFQYSVRIQHKGAYQTGLANLQCMYAPEFNSHSESVKIEVK